MNNNNKTYQCLIVEDEVLAQELLVSYIQNIPYLEVAKVCSTAIDAHVYLQQNPSIDLLFLDIEMPHLTGINFLKMLPNRNQLAVILTTAYKEYALEAFDLSVTDYLLKPIEFERFFQAVNKAIQKIEGNKNNVSPTTITTSMDNPSTAIKTTVPTENYFFVKADAKVIKLKFEEVLFIEGVQKYIRIHTNLPTGNAKNTNQQQKIITLLSLSAILEKLPASQFMRIHRSYIINLQHIEHIEGNMVRIAGQDIPISKGQKEAFFKVIEGRRFS